MKSRYALAALCALGFMTTACGMGKKVGDTFSSILGERADRTLETKRISIFEVDDKLRGAWAGKMIGVSMGAPYEFQYTGAIKEDALEVWAPELVSRALQQEDLAVAIAFLEVLRSTGMGATAEEIGPAFASKDIPFTHANEASRANIKNGVPPEQAGLPRNNPHANDTNFQAESEAFGLVTPGMSQVGRLIAEHFGDLVGYGDGLYGGLFIAGMHSAAFFETDRVEVVKQGLECVHPKSQYADTIGDVLAFYEKNPEDWQACWAMLQERWAEAEHCPDSVAQPINADARLNGGYVALGLLYGEGDLEKTLDITVRCGQDATSNAGSAAGVLGAILGYRKIPSKFSSGIPLIGDQKFQGSNSDFEKIISDCKRVAESIIERYGGQISRLGEREYYVIPTQEPRPPKEFERF